MVSVHGSVNGEGERMGHEGGGIRFVAYLKAHKRAAYVLGAMVMVHLSSQYDRWVCHDVLLRDRSACAAARRPRSQIFQVLFPRRPLSSVPRSGSFGVFRGSSVSVRVVSRETPRPKRLWNANALSPICACERLFLGYGCGDNFPPQASAMIPTDSFITGSN